jgi:peptide/nickel transport system permease protein
VLDQTAGGGGARDATTTAMRSSVRSRAAIYAVTVFVLITLNFFLPRAVPGDPITALLTSGTPSFVQSEELRAELEEYYGLDQPVLAQYVDYLGDLAQGDLGVSIRYNTPVADLVAERLPWTLLLVFSAMALAVVAGSIAGINSGWRRGRPADSGLLSMFLALRSFPVFFLGSIALFVLAVKFDLVPLAGAQSLSAGMGPLERAADIGYHLLLPAVVLASQFAGGHYLLMRAGMVGELGSDHLRGGRAKGLRERRLKYRYAARNALLPVVTVTALQLGGAITTSLILVETVFAYPGMGRLVFDSIEFRDYPALQACFLILSLVVVTLNFLADLLYRRLDPRTIR